MQHDEVAFRRVVSLGILVLLAGRVRGRRPACAGPSTGERGDIQVALAEYTALRQEAITALQAQQQVLNWSLATFGVFSAGGLAVAASDAANGPGGLRGMPLVLFAILFGLALPGAVIAAAAAWLGELGRMERVNRYMRGLELLVAEHYGVCPGMRVAGILRWETYLAAEDDEGSDAKLMIGYLGGAALYFGAFVVSQSLFLVAVLSHRFAAHDHALSVGAVAVSAVETGVFLLCTLVPGRRVIGLRRQGALDLTVFNPSRRS
jgi:hypothetical protein